MGSAGEKVRVQGTIAVTHGQPWARQTKMEDAAHEGVEEPDEFNKGALKGKLAEFKFC